MRRTWGKLMVGAALAASAAASFGAENDPEWQCWYVREGVPRIRCLETVTAEPEPRLVDIPIYIEPMSGIDFSVRLVKAVLCRQAGCAVSFDSSLAAASATLTTKR